MKFFAMIYSVLSYLIGFAALVYLILFIGDIAVPWTVNTASSIAPDFGPISAILWNSLLAIVWGSQHSLMANPSFKAVWTKIVPASVERSTYLLFVAAFTAGLVALWVPMTFEIWNVSGTVLGTALLIGFFLGWTITLTSTFLINHFHLFGLSQAYQLISQTPSKQETFVTPLFYKIVRHPMMTGVLIALWCAPVLTSGRLLFNITMTLYILLGTKHEEKTLVADLGEKYEDYRETTPMLIPGLGGK
jgi:protein-S-isoprenylcysteine O-methyltransferase Ste14